jgi:lipoic acid synthetase
MKPSWLKIKPPTKKFSDVKDILKNHHLYTVCQGAHCPNMSECWSHGTATFMVMGDTCTRFCRFCQVKHGTPQELDKDEPKNLAEAVKKLKLKYVVVTSVDRDDLEDLGSKHISSCIKYLKQIPQLKVEALIPDFQGNIECLKTVTEAKPDVLGHNIEVVERLQEKARDKRASYEQSLSVLRNIKKLDKKILTKSSIMLGLGETEKEVISAMKDLIKNKVDMITLGQYLQPGKKNLKVVEYINPEKFKYYEKQAYNMGFMFCASGPFVRSSYKAHEWVKK